MSTSSTTARGPRIRREAGRHYDDFEVGAIYEHTPGRTVSEADNTWFTLLTMNQHPLHFDHVFAAGTEFGRPIVNSCLTLSILTGMSVADVSQKAIANLGWTDIRMPAPVFHGDTLTAESEVLDKRLSSSRPGQGVVTVETRGFRQDGTLVMSFRRSVLVACRPADATGETA
ncbi:MAG: MaoC family dehydratase [Pseudomonadota bacterium]|nr:MaoC family dehydratase [Pseudomonadota bacterium]